MGNIEKIRDDLYVKKGWDGYRVVYPLRKDITLPLVRGNINWTNVVGQWHFWLKGLVFLIILYVFMQFYLSDTRECRDFITNMDTVCSQYQCNLNYNPTFPTLNLNLSELNLTNENT